MQPGDVFAGRYLIEDTLGRGGMGVVYLVLDQRLHRRAALKVMDARLSHDPVFRTRFEREAKAGARFEHPNVVQVHHYDEHEGTLYLVMQYVEGHDLRGELNDAGRLSTDHTLDIVRQVAAGLDAAHRQGQVHRDVKPANILLSRADGRALLTDFGLAQALDGGERLTSAGVLLGTVTYASPEQLRGEPASVRSDLYSLACVTYECLSGRPPFSGGPDVEIAQSHLRNLPPELATLVPGLASAVSAVVARGLSKHPGDRPESCGAFAAELGQAASPATGRTRVLGLAADPPTVAPAAPPLLTPAAEVPRPSRPTKAFALAAGAVLAVFGIGLALGLNQGGNAAGTTPTPTPSAAADPHVALARRLPAGYFSDCVAAPDREGKGRVTSLTCHSPASGVDEVLVSQWSDPAAMAADFTAAVAKRPDGTCGQYTGLPATGLRSTWGTGRPLACYVNTNQAAIVLWEHPSLSLQVLAVRKDGDAQAAFAWWRKAYKAPIT